jgi:hypothetical protein
LYRSFEAFRFILRSFKSNFEYMFTYYDLLNIYTDLRFFSMSTKGKLTDNPVVEGLLKLFRYYSFHFLSFHYNELPNTIPTMLLILMMREENFFDNQLFLYFSYDSYIKIWFSFFSTPFKDLAVRIFPLYKKWNGGPNLEFSLVGLSPSEFDSLVDKGDFTNFFHYLISVDPQDILQLGAKEEPPIILDLSKREIFLINASLRLVGKKSNLLDNSSLLEKAEAT